LDKFDSILSSVIDSHLGLRSTLIGYQYSEIIRAIFSVFCCGGDCMEDLNLYLKEVLTERPQTRIPAYGGRSILRHSKNYLRILGIIYSSQDPVKRKQSAEASRRMSRRIKFPSVCGGGAIR